MKETVREREFQRDVSLSFYSLYCYTSYEQKIKQLKSVKNVEKAEKKRDDFLSIQVKIYELVDMTP